MVLQRGEDARHFDVLYETFYDEFRKIAANYMRHERSGATLQATALVNEMYLRLHDKGIQWSSQVHFIRIFSLAMRRFLIDQSRRRRSRGAGMRIDPDRVIEIAKSNEFPVDEAIALVELVRHLARRSPRAASVLELHVLAGLSLREIAGQLKVSERTAKREWAYALCWLKMRMREKAP